MGDVFFANAPPVRLRGRRTNVSRASHNDVKKKLNAEIYSILFDVEPARGMKVRKRAEVAAYNLLLQKLGVVAGGRVLARFWAHMCSMPEFGGPGRFGVRGVMVRSMRVQDMNPPQTTTRTACGSSRRFCYERCTES